MNETLRVTLEELAFVVLILAILVALGGYAIYRYSCTLKDSTPNHNHGGAGHEAFLNLLKCLKNPDSSLEALSASIDSFLDVFKSDPPNIDDCALLLQLALKHKNIKGSLVLKLEHCFKDHYREESKLFEKLIVEGLKKM